MFIAGKYEAAAYGQGDFREGESFRSIFDAQTRAYSDLVHVHPGDITNTPWSGEPIEILFIDLAKTKDVNDFIIREMFPCLIPGRSIVIHEDYLFYRLPWIHITMERLAEHFELLCDTEYNSVVFGLTKQITRADVERAVWSAMAGEERVALMDQAISRWPDPKSNT